MMHKMVSKTTIIRNPLLDMYWQIYGHTGLFREVDGTLKFLVLSIQQVTGVVART